MVNALIPSELGRLNAYGANAPSTARIPIYYPSTGKISYVTPAQVAGGVGAVIGPSSAIDTTLAIFDGTSGKLIKNTLISATPDGDLTLNGNVFFASSNKGVILKQGSNGNVGTTTLTAGASTVSNTNVAITDAIILSLNTVGGTIAGQPYVATITAGVGFTVAGGGGSNTSTYNYAIIKNSA